MNFVIRVNDPSRQYHGLYVKRGGWFTDDLQDALVTKGRGRVRWARSTGYELIPVKIVLT